MFIAAGMVLLLSVFSFYTVQYGWGEPYPFFHFKLYSRPEGMNGLANSVGIYVNDSIRVNSQESNLYDTDEFNYALNSLLPGAQAGDRDAVNKLRLLVHSAYPGYPNYVIAEETYRAQAYVTHDYSFTKKVLLQLP